MKFETNRKKRLVTPDFVCVKSTLSFDLSKMAFKYRHNVDIRY